MTGSRVRWLILLTGLIVAAPMLSARETSPALTRDQQAEFLATARIVSHKNIPKGVTHPIRLTLTDGTVTHDAAFSSVNENKPIMHFADGRTELNFVDSYKYTVAAYQVGQLLGLDDMMPVAVARSIDHQMGSLTWWVDGVQFDEGDRVKQKRESAGSGRLEPSDVPDARVHAAGRRRGPEPDEPAHHERLETLDDRLHESVPPQEGDRHISRCDTVRSPVAGTHADPDAGR